MLNHLTDEITAILAEAEHAALATNGPHGLNVVPISVFAVSDGAVEICHFFLRKTIENVAAEPAAAFTAWTGFAGVQVKGEITISTSGEHFRAVTAQMQERFPERTLQAVLRLTPTAVYTVVPGQAGALLDN
ncbi:MAG: pyridoxamine 5'-phosphate oxidase family protein [Patescibacteria group bacterium]